jgi:ASPIC/UnbV protein/VCBS repeat protein
MVAVAMLVASAFPAGCGSAAAGDSTAANDPPTAEGFHLTDVAQRVGLDFRQGAFHWDVSADAPAMIGGGLCWIDYDGDGWLDLFVVNGYSQNERDEWLAAGGLPTTRLYRNHHGQFTDVTDETGAGLAVRGQGCVAADLNGDGNTDLFVTTAGQNQLLWNGGDGTFSEGAEAAGVGEFGWYTGAAAGDVNGDGRLDLVVMGYVDQANRIPEATLGFPNTHLGRRDLLFLNTGEGANGTATFREVGREVGMEVIGFAYGLGVVMSDFERDGDLDIYVANETNPNRLYENVQWPGGAKADPLGLGFRFEERGAPAGVADLGSGMGIADADFDGDGRSDLFISNSRGQGHAVYRSNPPDENDPSFTDVRADIGPDLSHSTGWGVNFADLDLDTDLDLLLVNGDVPVTDLAADAEPMKAYRNLGPDDPGHFEDVGERVGLAKVGRRLARGSAAADYDNDGDLDIAVLTVGGPLVLLENTGASGNWLEVAAEGFPPGTEATVVLPDGRELKRELLAGSSYLSSEDPRLHFGLGQADHVTELRVRWPGGEVTKLSDVEANRLEQVKAP